MGMSSFVPSGTWKFNDCFDNIRVLAYFILYSPPHPQCCWGWNPGPGAALTLIVNFFFSLVLPLIQSPVFSLLDSCCVLRLFLGFQVFVRLSSLVQELSFQVEAWSTHEWYTRVKWQGEKWVFWILHLLVRLPNFSNVYSSKTQSGDYATCFCGSVMCLFRTYLLWIGSLLPEKPVSFVLPFPPSH